MYPKSALLVIFQEYISASEWMILIASMSNRQG